MNIDHLVWDMAFHALKIPLEAREKYLREKSYKEDILLSNGTLFKNGVSEYPKFRTCVEADSLALIKYANDHFFVANRNSLDSYIHFETVLFYINKEVTSEKKEKIFTDVCEILLVDESYNSWRIKLLNEYSRGLGLSEKRIKQIKEEVLLYKYPKRANIRQTDYFLMTMFAILSGGSIDKDERAFFATLETTSLQRRVSKDLMLYLDYANKELDFTEGQKEKIMAICSTVVTCDGEISKKETAFFEFVMKELSISVHSMQVVRQYSGMGIHDILKNEDPSVISFCLYFALTMACADGVIHEKEYTIACRLFELLEGLETTQKELSVLLLCRFVVLKHQILGTNKALLTKINDFIIKEGVHTFQRALYVMSLTETEDRFDILKKYQEHQLSKKFAWDEEIDDELLLSFCLYMTKKEAPVPWQQKIKNDLLKLSSTMNVDDVKRGLSFILDMVIFDGHVEVLEDDAFIDLCCKNNISDDYVRREIFLSSYRNSDQIKISSYLNYGAFK
ncbi:hypothetical protein M899_0814 [Bacteriovorax sp. BSW11_IV]|uniref:hypothetical protein n=1 Tax=Bacteriovorax sp. BSW11_IV TaxID=1353529 RepID=UPI00038A2AFB|nr:hypothetical protein [Bacteriovorax sp. BSW11_IV]EQC49177.1 hypothetical protein M899_0814 [Bacteriovorax sp. BSW11_IV]